MSAASTEVSPSACCTDTRERCCFASSLLSAVHCVLHCGKATWLLFFWAHAADCRVCDESGCSQALFSSQCVVSFVSLVVVCPSCGDLLRFSEVWSGLTGAFMHLVFPPFLPSGSLKSKFHRQLWSECVCVFFSFYYTWRYLHLLRLQSRCFEGTVLCQGDYIHFVHFFLINTTCRECVSWGCCPLCVQSLQISSSRVWYDPIACCSSQPLRREDWSIDCSLQSSCQIKMKKEYCCL